MNYLRIDRWPILTAPWRPIFAVCSLLATLSTRSTRLVFASLLRPLISLLPAAALPPLRVLFAGRIFAGQLFAGQLFAGQLFAGQVLTRQVFTMQLFTGHFFTGQLLAGQLFAGRMCLTGCFGGCLPKTRPAVLVILLASIANVATGSESADFDRSRFGRSDLPLWSELTGAERAIIASRDRLVADDPDALLNFFLLASGNVRQQENFARYRRQIDDWVSANSKAFRIRDEQRRGRRLHEAMHDAFLGQSGQSEFDGYDVDQSRLSTLLDTKDYNCISSALLYAVLARKAGLQAEGVIMPSHAFVQLTLDDGDVIEVETTSRGGYDLEHDAEFYSPQSGNWFSDRDLEMPTLADYQQRKIVSLFQLGLENIWSQHTHSSRMGYADRMRLAEIRAHLQPDDIDAQKNRLFFYTREFSHLNAREDWPTLLRLYATIGPWLDELDRESADLQFANLLAWVESGRAVAQLHSDQPAQALQMARTQLRDLHKRISDADEIRSNLFFVVAEYANRHIEAKRFDRARAIFEGLEFDCLANAMCANSLARLYADWAQHFWDKRQWEQAIALYEAYLKMDERGETAQIFRSNLESAYLNWANTALYDDDWQTASRRLGQCTTALPDARHCEDLQDRIQRKRNSGIF
jgi:regulator of sirC expression with transglutaminase-like and TPR domain